MESHHKEYDFFISYAHNDASEFAFWLANQLKESNFSVFLDKTDIMIGDEIIDVLTKGIHGSSYFIMLMTPSYFESGWCRKEMFQILTREANEAKSIILPIQVSPCTVPPHISSKLWFKLDRNDWSQCIETITLRIRRDKEKITNTENKTVFQNELKVLDLTRDKPTVGYKDISEDS